METPQKELFALAILFLQTRDFLQKPNVEVENKNVNMEQAKISYY